MLYLLRHDRSEGDIWHAGRMSLATLTCLAEVIIWQGTLIYRALMHTAAGAIAAVVKLPALPRGASVVKPSGTALRALYELRRGRLSPFLPVLLHGASWRRRVNADQLHDIVAKMGIKVKNNSLRKEHAFEKDDPLCKSLQYRSEEEDLR